ncbi:PH domain-containing protein [Nesterenkonia rhizosphaerae]|uniref:YdbS-like PH domain-containing protein n=1 Tax=Nesterenkonia rhizosphaerae TaxID=1348272 RepID=A0ABP9FWK4_9MICC
MKIKKDARPVLWSLAWSWILFFIPTLLIWVKWNSVKTTVSGTSITQKSGRVAKSYVNIDMSKVQNITATESPFKGGTLTVHTTSGTEELKYIKNPGEAANTLRQLVNEIQ